MDDSIIVNDELERLRLNRVKMRKENEQGLQK